MAARLRRPASRRPDSSAGFLYHNPILGLSAFDLCTRTMERIASWGEVPSPLRSRRYRLHAGVALAIAVLAILPAAVASAVTGPVEPSSLSSDALEPTAKPASASGTDLVAAAVASLDTAGCSGRATSVPCGLVPASPAAGSTPLTYAPSSSRTNGVDPPPARWLASIAYDAKDGYAVLFGGNEYSANFGDTWKFVNDKWTNITTTPSPSVRSFASMAYDAHDGYVVLFGGGGASGNLLADTWKFVGGVWKNITPSVSPSPRDGAGMAYDTDLGELVLFGGQGSSALLNDTWTFRAGSWSQLLPHTSPPARRSAGMTFDSTDSHILLFGGLGSAGDLSDTWSFSGGQWTQHTPTVHPSARVAASLTFDSGLGYVVLFGGRNDTTGNVLGDSWKFVGGVWTLLHPSYSPTPRQGASMVYDPSIESDLLFGGWNSTVLGSGSQHFLNDTWEFVGAFWAQVPFTNPPARSSAMMTFDAKDGYVLVFGGNSADTWKFSGGVWTNITRVISPSARSGAGIAYDAKDGYVVLFGGISSLGQYLADTWKFMGGVWTNITPTPSPLPRNVAGMTYDAADGYVVIFGGYCPQCAGGHAGDTWKFSSGAWTQLSPVTSPSARNSMMMTYDTKDGYVLMFGGDGCAPVSCHSETWKFSGGAWTNITTGSAPLGRYLAVMTYDPTAGYVVLYGGCHALSSPCGLSDTWKFVGGLWTNISGSAGIMPAQAGAALAFDPSNHFAILLGNVYSPYTWVFFNGKWVEL
jgi:hypothetical protein